MSFPKDFIWGAASSSYQIEGAWNEDGKGLSVWDMMVRQPGKVWERDNGDVACDHYHRYKEDVALMADLGLRAYRFSISWPRVLPEGVGRINKAGLDFYDKLVDELLKHQVVPWVTLFHWDYPYELFLRGGWLNPDSPKWFAEYTQVVVDRLSDRVSHWMTLNEPQCFIGMGHLSGEQAPGLKLGMSEALLAAHHCLMAHGLSVQTLRARAKSKPQVGWAPIGPLRHPRTHSPADLEIGCEVAHSVEGDNFWSSAWWGDPVVLGHYPEEGLKAYGDAMPRYKSSDLDVIKQPLDFYGCNCYHGSPVEVDENGKPRRVPFPPGHPLTLTFWKVTSEILYWGPKLLAERYKLPIVITENGMSNLDWVHQDGKVHDSQRIDFLALYLTQLGKAIDDGVDIRGYFQWSFMDNFEWQDGYRQRLGLIHVDYTTQKRTLKDSAHWYRELIKTDGGILNASKS